jgi:hypothetical protein
MIENILALQIFFYFLHNSVFYIVLNPLLIFLTSVYILTLTQFVIIILQN